METDVNITSHTLISRLKNVTDNDAWTEFQDFYWGIITGWAKRYGCSQSLSKDVFQETMLNLFKNMPEFELRPEKGHFRSYLKTIVSRRVHDAYRRNKKYILSDDSDSELNWSENIEDKSGGLECEDDAVWINNILQQALRQTYQKVDELTYKSFCLYVLDGLPVKEVSEKLSISREGTIYQQKSRFLSILKKELCELLDNLGEDSIDYSFINKDSDALTKTLEEMLKDKSDFRETIIQNQPPIDLMGQIEFVRGTLNLNKDFKENGLLLFQTDSPEDGIWYSLNRKLSLGRGDSCDLVLKADGVSNYHASIKIEKETYIITDEQSTNGVFINGKKIETSAFLCNGDVIQISSKYSLIVHLKS